MLYTLEYNFDDFILKSARTINNKIENIEQFSYSVKFLLELIQIPSMTFSPKVYTAKIFSFWETPEFEIDNDLINSIL